MIENLIKIGLSLFLSFLIGWEREQSAKEAGLRTVLLIGLGTTVFTMIPFLLVPIAKELNMAFDFSRIISYVIGGAGFFTGIVIVHNKKQVEGITTSACLWAVVASSILIGIGEYILAMIVSLCIWLILQSKYFRIKILKK